jgi:uncharacterized membrane protein HdeD (DUF308 family)
MNEEHLSTQPASNSAVRHELQHMQQHWCWFLLLGALLTMGGTAAIVVPLLTATASLVAMIVLGLVLMIAGAAVMIGSIWAGQWSGMLVHLLVGILYLGIGFLIIDNPVQAVMVATLYIAMIFILLGTFRIVAALVVHFPQWGWALLNGVVTLLAGIVIYKHFPKSALWVIGLLVGLEMLFNGWGWIMLALGLRKLRASENVRA